MCLMPVSNSYRMKLFSTLSSSALELNSLLFCPLHTRRSLRPKASIKNQLSWSRHYITGSSGTFLVQNCRLSSWSRCHNDPGNLWFHSSRWIFPHTPIEKNILRLQTSIPDLKKKLLQILNRVPQTCFFWSVFSFSC